MEISNYFQQWWESQENLNLLYVQREVTLLKSTHVENDLLISSLIVFALKICSSILFSHCCVSWQTEFSILLFLRKVKTVVVLSSHPRWKVLSHWRKSETKLLRNSTKKYVNWNKYLSLLRSFFWKSKMFTFFPICYLDNFYGLNLKIESSSMKLAVLF